MKMLVTVMVKQHIDKLDDMFDTIKPDSSVNTDCRSRQNQSFANSFWQTQQRIRHLVDTYLTNEILCDRLQDLPQQFTHPQPRTWKTINWQEINRAQIHNIDFDVFLAILKGSLDTEAPIRDYTQTSRKYLQDLHPPLACFVGGKVNKNGELIDLGLWEKEERQHTPALTRIYQILTGEKIIPTLRTPRGYLPTDNPREDLYRHGLHRVATEYGATCLYLWVMAHTTGAVYDVFEQLLIDEINHMTKFWGFGVWAYPQTSLMQVIRTLWQTRDRNYERNSLFRTLGRMMGTLQWEKWTVANKFTLLCTFCGCIYRMWSWNKQLTTDYLQKIFEIS